MSTALKSDIETRHLQGYSELTLAAPIRQGLVASLDTRTHLTRLKQVLDTLHLLRATSREYSLLRPYNDATDRIRTINSLRMWVDEAHMRLVLSVGFDRPWEAYLRIVWREVGPLLDLVFCNCEGYPVSRRCSFAEYGRWITTARCDTRFFYNAGNLTFDDQQYLVQLERLVRRTPAAHGLVLELAAAQLGVATPRQASANVVQGTPAARVGPPGHEVSVPVGALEAATQGLQALSVLYRLTDVYPPGTPDGEVLERAATSLLEETQLEPVKTLLTQPAALARFADPLAWLAEALRRRPQAPAPDEALPAPPTPQGVQPGILEPYRLNHTHGAVLLVSVTEPRSAAAFIERLRARVEASIAAGDDQRHVTTVVAFSAEGLARLGLDEDALQAFPVEFREGMARRAGLLGDVRGNHPDRWLLPVVNWFPDEVREHWKGQKGRCDEDPIRLHPSAAHIVVQLLAVREAVDGDHEIAGNPAHPLHGEIRTLMDGAKGVVLWSVQAMRRHGADPEARQAAAADRAAMWPARGHFGYVDGISQPVLSHDVDPEGPWGPGVPLGEVLLGQPNVQGDPPSVPALLRDGSFLVLRKLAQDVPAFEACLTQAAADYLAAKNADVNDARALAGARELIAAKMMGRCRNGAALVGPETGSTCLGQDDPRVTLDNDFDFSDDADGSRCPLASHVRRANPRTTPLRSVPRLVRRGMSYGPRHAATDGVSPGDRGLMFMAYVARLGEQFETVQRWISGGNGSDGQPGPSGAPQDRPVIVDGVLKRMRPASATGTASAEEPAPVATLYSGDTDPLLGVPLAGEPRIFRFVHEGQVHRVALDRPVPGDPSHQPRPFVTLQWGTYLFAPSLQGMSALAQRARLAPPTLAAPPRVPAEALVRDGAGLLSAARAAQRGDPVGRWKALLEDSGTRRNRQAQAAWAALRAREGGALRTDYGVLVGSLELVNQVLRNAEGHYTVAGYRERQDQSIGGIHLGLDGGPAYRAQASKPNQLVAGWTEKEGIETGYRLTHEVLHAMAATQREMTAAAKLPAGGEFHAAPRWELTVEVREIVDRFLARWTREWFDLPDGRHIMEGRWNWHLQPVRCPAHFTAPSRYIFQPHPGQVAVEDGRDQGQAALRAVRDFVAERRRSGGLEGAISKPLFEALPDDAQGNDLLARTLLGLMIGLLPTVDGCLRSVLYEWMEGGDLWVLQSAWLACSTPDRHGQAAEILRQPLLRTLMRRPVPELIWRRATREHTIGRVRVEPGDTIVLGLVSAAHEALESDDLDAWPVLFGGAYGAKGKPLHACPGQSFALGAMLGFLAALLEAGTLYRTPAPLTLRLRGPKWVGPTGTTEPTSPDVPGADGAGHATAA